MTSGQVLFWILVAILFIILFKISIAIFWIIAIIVVIYFIVRWINDNKTETFQPVGSVSEVWQEPIQRDEYVVYDSAPCQIPSSVSEYCVHKRLQEGYDLDFAIEQCIPSTPSSANCANDYCI